MNIGDQAAYNITGMSEFKGGIGMSRTELRKFSVVEALRCLAENKPLPGLVREASDEMARRLGRTARGFFLPSELCVQPMDEEKDVNTRASRAVAESVSYLLGQEMSRRGDVTGAKRALNATVGTAGGFTVGENIVGSSLIELLRNRMVTSQVGATMLSNLSSNVGIPKVQTGANVAWVEEGQEVPQNTQSFGEIKLAPKQVGGLSIFTKQLLNQSSIDVEAFVRQDLVSGIAIERDRAALNGSGAREPLGLMSATGANSITFGGAPTWEKVVEFETKLEEDNASVNEGALAYVTTGAVRGKWKTVPKATGEAIYIWPDTQPAFVNGHRALVSNQIPGDRVIYADWSQLVLADWAGLDITVDPFTRASFGEIRVIVFQLVDNAVRHAQSFCISSDSGAQS